MSNPANRIVATNTIATASDSGEISIYVSDTQPGVTPTPLNQNGQPKTTDLIVDINGYFRDAGDPNGLAFYPIPPCRVVDTRPEYWASYDPDETRRPILGSGKLAANETRPFNLATVSRCGLLPSNLKAYALNVTVVPDGSLGYVTVFPGGTGGTRPIASLLNDLDGRVLANGGIFTASTTRSVSLYTTTSTHIVMDISGYFAPEGAANGQLFNGINPCRAANRIWPPISSLGGSESNPMNCGGVPTTAEAYALNAVVKPQGLLSFITLWPTGLSQPVVSLQNAVDGLVASNGALIPAGIGGNISTYLTNPVAEYSIDITGYFSLAPSSPSSPSYAGYIDTVSTAEVRGWALNMDNPNGTIDVTAYDVDTGATIETLTANLANTTSNGHGFRLQFPWSNVSRRRIGFRVANTAFVIPGGPVEGGGGTVIGGDCTPDWVVERSLRVNNEDKTQPSFTTLNVTTTADVEARISIFTPPWRNPPSSWDVWRQRGTGGSNWVETAGISNGATLGGHTLGIYSVNGILQSGEYEFAGQVVACDVWYAVLTSRPVNVYDTTPVIETISPDPWTAGQTGLQVLITGKGFGTNPTVSIPGVSFQQGQMVVIGDRQRIPVWVNVPPNAPPSYLVTVTANSNGNAFYQMPNSPPPPRSATRLVTVNGQTISLSDVKVIGFGWGGNQPLYQSTTFGFDGSDAVLGDWYDPYGDGNVLKNEPVVLEAGQGYAYLKNITLRISGSTYTGPAQILVSNSPVPVGPGASILFGETRADFVNGVATIPNINLAYPIPSNLDGGLHNFTWSIRFTTTATYSVFRTTTAHRIYRVFSNRYRPDGEHLTTRRLQFAMNLVQGAVGLDQIVNWVSIYLTLKPGPGPGFDSGIHLTTAQQQNPWSFFDGPLTKVDCESLSALAVLILRQVGYAPDVSKAYMTGGLPLGNPDPRDEELLTEAGVQYVLYSELIGYFEGFVEFREQVDTGTNDPVGFTVAPDTSGRLLRSTCPVVSAIAGVTAQQLPLVQLQFRVLTSVSRAQLVEYPQVPVEALQFWRWDHRTGANTTPMPPDQRLRNVQFPATGQCPGEFPY